MKNILLCIMVSFCFSLTADDSYDVEWNRSLSKVSKDSVAKSMNQEGVIVGQYTIPENQNGIDYICSMNSELNVITTEAAKGVYPCINNKGQVAGVLATHEIYLFDPENGLQILGQPKSGWFFNSWQSEEIAVLVLNDNGIILIADNQDISQAKLFAIWRDGQFKVLFAKNDMVKFTALNNHNILLRSNHHTINTLFGVMDVSKLLALANLDTHVGINIAEDNYYIGYGINDHQQVIAQDKAGKQGYFYSQESGMVYLGSFLPAALNNHGDIVGQENSNFYVKKQGEGLVDLDDAMELTMEQIEGVVDRVLAVYAINDKGEILASAEVWGRIQPILLVPCQTQK